MTDPVLEALWKRVVDSWEDDGAHGAFLDHCHRTRQLLEAAVRYRGMSGDHARGPSAGKRLEAIAMLAVTSLQSDLHRQRPEGPRALRVATQIVLIAVFVAATIALGIQLYR